MVVRSKSARTTMTKRTRLSRASRVCCVGLKKTQPSLDPAPRRKALLAPAKIDSGDGSVFVSTKGSILMSVEAHAEPCHQLRTLSRQLL